MVTLFLQLFDIYFVVILRVYVELDQHRQFMRIFHGKSVQINPGNDIIILKSFRTEMSFYNTIISGWGRFYREGLTVHSGKMFSQSLVWRSRDWSIEVRLLEVE